MIVPVVVLWWWLPYLLRTPHGEGICKALQSHETNDRGGIVLGVVAVTVAARVIQLHHATKHRCRRCWRTQRSKRVVIFDRCRSWRRCWCWCWC